MSAPESSGTDEAPGAGLSVTELVVIGFVVGAALYVGWSAWQQWKAERAGRGGVIDVQGQPVPPPVAPAPPANGHVDTASVAAPAEVAADGNG